MALPEQLARHIPPKKRSFREDVLRGENPEPSLGRGRDVRSIPRSDVQPVRSRQQVRGFFQPSRLRAR